MSRRFYWFVAFVIACGAVGYGYYRYQAAPATSASGSAAPGGGGRRGGAGDPPPLVVAQHPVTRDVPVFLDAVGTVLPLKTVTVRSQVSGKLIAVSYKEGQMVKAGDVLARIDPVAYQAAYDQAVAKKAQDEALLANARMDLDRYEKLAADKATSRQQADTQKALVAQYAAQVAYDQATIDNARATLGYTTITAPIDGRTGLRQVDEGNLVSSTDASGIVVITQIDPIAVTFSVPQQALPLVTKAMTQGAPRVVVTLGDGGPPVDRGVLEVVDNQIDQTTGTVKLKAVVPNADSRLWAGQFVSLRVLVDRLTDRITVPSEAIQRGPNGPFLYGVVDGKVHMRPISIQRDADGIAVISGVETSESIVTSGFSRLSDGAAVRVADPAAQPAAGAAPARGPRAEGQAPGGNGERRRRPEGNGAAPAPGNGTPPSAPGAPRP